MDPAWRRAPCASCSKEVTPWDPQARHISHGARRFSICGPCYTAGKFSARCVVCGKDERVAPLFAGDPYYACLACQWSDHVQRQLRLGKAARLNSD